MQPVIDFITANPLYGIGLALLLAFLIFSLVKKALKLVVIAALLNVAYSYYLHDLAQTAYERAESTLQEAAEQAGDMLR